MHFNNLNEINVIFLDNITTYSIEFMFHIKLHLGQTFYKHAVMFQNN